MKTLKGYPLIAILIEIGVSGISLMTHCSPLLSGGGYHPESWRGENGAYQGFFEMESKPGTGLFASIYFEPNIPIFGYPYHIGIVEGLSDTIVLIVSIDNRNESSYDISAYQPDNWLYTVTYSINDDPTNSQMLSEPSGFGYSFKHWYTFHHDIVSHPTEVPPESGGNDRCDLCYYIWGIPAGRYWVTMEKTEYAPDEFKILANSMNTTWINKPTNLANTLNAFISCFWRADKCDSSQAEMNWVDSILTYNPSSIPWWTLKRWTYQLQWDSLRVVSTFDSTIAIIKGYGDKVLPESIEMDSVIRSWYQITIHGVTNAKSFYLKGGDQWKFKIR